MPYRQQKPNPTSGADTYDLANTRWLIADDGQAFPIVHQSRRRVVVDAHLKRRRLERDGYDTDADGYRFSVTTYLRD